MRYAVGIICEYDPFHRGHARQFELIREQLPDAMIVCLMSGCFTQRGMPALFSPAFRAEAALRAGAAVVLELPCVFAVRDAEHFALGGVAVFDRLASITHLSFGTENPDLETLWNVAKVLESPDDAFQTALKQALAEGRPFAAAQARGIAAALRSDDIAGTVSAPNNILAVCYLRALLRLQSNVLPLPVRREGSYHSDTLICGGWPSASAVRRAYLTGDTGAAEEACGYPLAGETAHHPEALDAVVLNMLRSMDADALRAFPDCSEGLEYRLQKAAAQATGRSELLGLLKTKRYTRARLNRLVTHAVLGLRAEMANATPLPPYVRLLGFRREYSKELAFLKAANIPVISKASDYDRENPLFRLDERAYDLWALGAGLPAGLLYRQQIVIV